MTLPKSIEGQTGRMDCGNWELVFPTQTKLRLRDFLFSDEDFIKGKIIGGMFSHDKIWHLKKAAPIEKKPCSIDRFL
jgi:hypothetical protein